VKKTKHQNQTIAWISGWRSRWDETLSLAVTHLK